MGLGSHDVSVELGNLLFKLVHLSELVIKVVRLRMGIVRLNQLVVGKLDDLPFGVGLRQIVRKQLNMSSIVRPLVLIQGNLLQQRSVLLFYLPKLLRGLLGQHGVKAGQRG